MGLLEFWDNEEKGARLTVMGAVLILTLPTGCAASAAHTQPHGPSEGPHPP